METEGLEALYKKYNPYLVEIRKRLMLLVVIFVLNGVIGFIYYERIVRLILDMLDLRGVNVVFTSPFQFFELSVSTGMLVGIAVTLPIIVYNFLSFIRPALSKREFNTIRVMTPFSLILFIIGFGAGFSIMRYVVMIFYENSQKLDIGNFLDITKLLSQILVTAGLMGVAFQFPIVVTLLIRLNAVPRQFFVRQRPIAYGISILFAAILPPTDILSMVILTLPLVFLFEGTLLLNKILVKPKGR